MLPVSRIAGHTFSESDRVILRNSFRRCKLIDNFGGRTYSWIKNQKYRNTAKWIEKCALEVNNQKCWRWREIGTQTTVLVRVEPHEFWSDSNQ